MYIDLFEHMNGMGYEKMFYKSDFFKEKSKQNILECLLTDKEIIHEYIYLDYIIDPCEVCLSRIFQQRTVYPPGKCPFYV